MNQSGLRDRLPMQFRSGWEGAGPVCVRRDVARVQELASDAMCALDIPGNGTDHRDLVYLLVHFMVIMSQRRSGRFGRIAILHPTGLATVVYGNRHRSA
jgi:hypothetical protein